MSDDQITIEVDGQALAARKGQMLMAVTDEAGIYIPRFCYHKKLSVAANCRMCLVEVEKAPKPMPACATPVQDGMKVMTQSDKARLAQRATMEFLLINHPLDCPICDQGGECELQDLALGFGGDISQYQERKRIIRDENLGPLIATDMTRCIHCTRCVRFGEEIAGYRELGAVGRGEHMQIGTYVGKTVEHELSGNVIDLCPVGALTAKPSRYTARPWELQSYPAVSPHDAVGANLWAHVRGGRLMRVVPRDNEAVNETWIADRDRFSYRGLYSEDRLTAPLLWRDGDWEETDWETALEAAVEALRQVPAGELGILASSHATVEELYLLRRLADGIGCRNIDHRLRQADFSDQARAPVFPWLGQGLADLETVSAAVVVGSNLRKELPLVHHRLRKAALAGARIGMINPADFDFRMPLAEQIIDRDLIGQLAAVAAAVAEVSAAEPPAALGRLIGKATPSGIHLALAKNLAGTGARTILLGHLAEDHPQFSILRALAGYIAEASGARLGYLPAGGNAAGAWLAGAVPHRGFGGRAVETAGRHAGEMLARPMRGYLLFGIEPELDAYIGARALSAIEGAERVVAITPYFSPAIQHYAHVVLPVGAFTETSGTYVNLEGHWQSFAGSSVPVGESRPAWKVLRVMGNLLNLAGFDYISSEDVLSEARAVIGDPAGDNRLELTGDIQAPASLPRWWRLGEIPIYASDPLVRRSAPLQATPDAQCARTVYLHPSDAESLGVLDADQVTVKQGEGRATLALALDPGLARGCVRIAAGIPETRMLAERFGEIELTPA